MQNKKTKIFSIVLSVLVSAMLVAGAVMAATTIGTNITTTGTLSVTDTSTLTGATTVTGALYANGGLDRSGVAALTIGGTNASAVDISKTLITTTVKGLLNVDEAVTFDTTLGVTGISTLTGLLNADGGVAVDTTNFTVSGTTGAVHTAGDFDVATNKFTVAAASGNTLIAGTLDVTGVITGALTGNASTATSATSATSATTAANLAGGLANQIAYQTDAGATGFLTAGTDGQFLVANVAGLPVFVTMSGDVTTSNAGVTAIGALKVTNTMIAASTIDLTAKVTGVLPTANGGTGIAYFTAAGPTVARVYTFPDAAATIARTDAGQTFTGVNTMTSPIFITPAIGAATGASLVLTGAVTAGTNVISSVADTLTAVGTTQADALALTADYNNVTVGAIATGVKLPVAVAGMDITVRNSVANTIHIYSAAAETLNGTAGPTGLNLDASLGTRCVAMSTSVWLCNKIGAIED